MEEKVFLEDIYPQNFLYAKTIRSPVAKGHLKFIQFPKMPEEYIFITARDIPGINTLSDTSMPILAEGDLSYIGEPIALLLGEDKTKLNEFASMCNVICDEGKPVFSCLETTENEPAVKRELLIGETKEAFQRQGKIVTGTYITGIQDHWYAEPAGAITWFKTEQEKKDVKTKKSNPAFEKTLVVKTATQWSHHVKRSVAQTLGLDPSDISVEPTSLSLHMDGKLWYPSFLACHAALGTFITGRPVRLILNREEDFLYSPKRFSTNVDVSSVVDEEGNISATEIDIFVNLGAHEVNGREILDQACLGALGFYDLGDTKISARADKTNIPPQGPFSGFGMSQGFFSLERHVSMIADLTGQDPAVWRINHLRPILSSAGKNQVFAAELINTAAKMGDYHRKWASYELLRQSNKGKQLEKGENPRGIGIALGFQGNGLLYTGEDKGAYSVEVTLTKESKLEIKTSISSAEDYVKIWEKVASQVMSLEPDMIRIITENAPDSGPSCASRNITAITKLVEKCCLAIRKQRFHDPLPITVRRSIKPQNGSLYGGFLSAPEGSIMDINGFTKFGQACAVVEVSVDLIECAPKIRGVWLGVDGGKIVSSNRAKRNITRSAIQALGWAFTEYIEYIKGSLPKNHYENFSIPSPVDIPPIHIEFIPGDNEPKGIGELPFTCIPAAFLQAVSQAMDHSFKSIPLKRKEIWEMLRFRNDRYSAQGPVK